MTYDEALDELLVSSGHDGDWVSATWSLEIDTGARFETFGSACAIGGALPALVPTGAPQIGTTFKLSVVWPGPGSSVLALGLSDATFAGNPLPIPLTGVGLGAPGCWLQVAPDFVVLPTTAPGTYDVIIPPSPAWVGTCLYAQGFVFDGVDVGTTTAARIVVGT